MKNFKIVLLITFLAILFGCNNHKDAIVKSAPEKPLLVLTEVDPWAELVGADSPTFVLYNDGTVIYKVKNDQYKTTILTESEMKQFQIDTNFYSLKENYLLTNATDQPFSIIYFWEGDKSRQVGVYGNIREEGKINSPAFIPPDEDYPTDKVPEIFMKLYKRIISFDKKDAHIWIPDKIRVYVWPFEYSKKKPLVWPKNWPDLNAQETKKRKKDSYTIYLDSKHLNELSVMKKKMSYDTAVLINGKKWAMDYRLIFPYETMWQKI